MKMPIHTWLVVTLTLLGTLSACAHDATQRAVPAVAVPAVAVPAVAVPAVAVPAVALPALATPAETKPTETKPPQAEPTAVRSDAATDVGRPSKPPDHEQPIHIKADRIEINQKKSTTSYIGRVSLTQGGLRINAARVEASYKGDKIDTVIASGKPVTLFQQSEIPGQDLHASALRLEYHALDNKADLFDEVRLQQGANVVLCNTLHYDLAESILSAEGDGADGRVTVTIEPSAIEKPVTPRAVPDAQKQNHP